MKKIYGLYLAQSKDGAFVIPSFNYVILYNETQMLNAAWVFLKLLSAMLIFIKLEG
jgi:hypothetical protein